MSEKLPEGALCAVCEDFATGNHYSVPSCNGCKTFFRRAVVNNRVFACMGNGDCPVNKGVRCACRHCRLKKCLQVGMDRNSIQNDRDRIGYTKRTRRSNKTNETKRVNAVGTNSTPPISSDDERTVDDSGKSVSSEERSSRSPRSSNYEPSLNSHPAHFTCSPDPILDRLTVLENNFTLLLSRAEIDPYGSLDEALSAPSRFNLPINVKMTDPVASPKPGQDQQTTPFWRSRIIALYIDWAKTFAAFRDLPHSDKVALITNHASSYMIMCKAFRTPERTLMDDGFYADRAFPQEGEPQSNEMLRNSREQQHSLSTGVICSAVPRSFSTPALGNHFFYDNPHRHEQQQKLSYLSEQANISLTTFSAMNIMKNVATECCQRQQLEEQQDMLQKRNMHAFFEPTIVSFENKNGINDISINGLTPVMTAMIDLVMKPFRRLNITTTEFAALQAVMFFDPDTEGLDSASQRNVSAEQKKLLTALYRHICGHYSLLDASDRFASILLRIPTIRKVAAKKNETLQIIDLFNLSNINSLVKETALGIRSTNAGAPTVLSAMDADFKPIL